MSAINDALAKLAKESTSSSVSITKANITPVKQRSVIPWVVGSFGLSLAVGGWAVSQQAPTITDFDTLEPASQHLEIASPTQKVTPNHPSIYKATNEDSQPQPQPVVSGEQQRVDQKTLYSTQVKPVSLAQNQPANKQVVTAPAGQVVIEHVELTPQQLSEKAQQRAKKALDSNNLSQALSQYNEALMYTPADVQVRKRLAALYYGKGEVRKAAEILQKGIVLNSDDTELRLSLAKMLMKEQQNSVALTVLSALPKSASVEYLALRAALAQKEKQDDLALQSYQQLVIIEPSSARWWLGLAIQQERAFDLTAAKRSYNEALTKLGLSGQSQQFIRDRLTLIRHLEESSSEN